MDKEQEKFFKQVLFVVGSDLINQAKKQDLINIIKKLCILIDSLESQLKEADEIILDLYERACIEGESTWRECIDAYDYLLKRGFIKDECNRG